jgi:osmotically-inducible protein OsmY
LRVVAALADRVQSPYAERLASMRIQCNVNRPERRYASALAVALSGALCACAAYEKCGFGGCPGDAQLAAAVQASFQGHPELQPPNLLTVQSVDHVVYLSGLVDTDFQRQMAEDVAHRAPGVTKVVNSIGLAGNSR